MTEQTDPARPGEQPSTLDLDAMANPLWQHVPEVAALIAEVRRLDDEAALSSDQAAWIDNENRRLRATLDRVRALLAAWDTSGDPRERFCGAQLRRALAPEEPPA